MGHPLPVESTNRKLTCFCVVGFYWLMRSERFGITSTGSLNFWSCQIRRNEVPGLSGSVALNSAIVFSKALGKADVEQDVPLTTASVHR